MTGSRRRRAGFLVALAAASFAGVACGRNHETIGNPDRGKQLITQYGCTSCHQIPGIQGPKGSIGPSLQKIALHPFIAGKVPNTPQNTISWLQNPQASDPASAMPNLGLKPDEARDITAYLFTLR